jgi:hypothetical protein
MNIGPLIRTVEELYTAPPLGRLHGAPAETSARLLELRTDSGLVYLCPSGWQRMRLLWIFRHFHILPPQLLSRSDQRLIERLSRSALVTPALPVPRNTVFGVVEKVHKKADDAIVFFEEPATSADQDRPVPVARSLRFPQWRGALATVLAICLILILARVYVRRSPAASRPTVQAAGQPVLRIVVRVPPPILPSAEKVEHSALPPEVTPVARKSAPARHVQRAVIESSTALVPAPVEPAAIAPSDTAQLPLVTALPQGHLVQPILSDPKLVGELDLRALIAADGSVKDVTLVSGNPKLAEAGMRAVRRWHYAQSQAPGLDGEREALIRMNFFGQDAVSISSVAR